MACLTLQYQGLSPSQIDLHSETLTSHPDEGTSVVVVMGPDICRLLFQPYVASLEPWKSEGMLLYT